MSYNLNLEMRFVAISDFDDGYPKGLTKKLTNERPDAILACGDFCYGTEIRKAMFANYDSDVQWYDAIGRKKAKQLMYESVEKGAKVIQQLDSIGVPVFMVYGNHDKTGTDSKKKDMWSVYKKNLFNPLIDKFGNAIDVDLSKAQLGAFTIIGYGQNNFSPEVPQYTVQKQGLTKADIKKRGKKYHNYLKSLDNLFKDEDPSTTIFMTHNVPFKTKLDKIINPAAPKSVQGKHFGSLVARRIAIKYQPLFTVGGHIHEGQGIDNMGKTVCINNGSGAQGNYTVIDIQPGRVKVKLK